MNATDLRAAIAALGLTVNDTARLLGHRDPGRKVRRWLAGGPIPSEAERLLRLLVLYEADAKEIMRVLNVLTKGLRNPPRV